jgi:ribosome-binding factor A
MHEDNYRKQQLAEVLRESVSEFIKQETNNQSLITITNVVLGNDFKTVTLFVTVFPEHKENAAIDFLKRQRSEVRAHLKKMTRIPRIPHIDFAIDTGEKSRQRIDEISRDL